MQLRHGLRPVWTVLLRIKSDRDPRSLTQEICTDVQFFDMCTYPFWEMSDTCVVLAAVAIEVDLQGCCSCHTPVGSDGRRGTFCLELACILRVRGLGQRYIHAHSMVYNEDIRIDSADSKIVDGSKRTLPFCKETLSQTSS